MQDLIKCTQEDLIQISSMFKDRLLEAMPDDEAKVKQLTEQFDQALQSRVEIVSSFNESQDAQEIKAKIEQVQRKGAQLKAQITAKQTKFIEGVRAEAQSHFNAQVPFSEIDKILENVDSIRPPELPSELKAVLYQLDIAIKSVNKSVQQNMQTFNNQLQSLNERLQEIEQLNTNTVSSMY